MVTISSLSNPSVKSLLRLKKAGDRKKQGLFIIDGRREIGLALSSDWEISTLFYCSELADNHDLLKIVNLKRREVIDVSESVFRKICYKENPDGFLATAKPREISLDKIKLGSKPLLIVLEQVEKPGNLGAILRTAYAVGVTAVIINDNQTDIYNPNVIRASEGMIFSQTVIQASVSETIAWLKKYKIKSFAAATKGSKNYTDVDFTGSAAIIFGSESKGLSPEWLEAADRLVKIPMCEGIDSLNVSVSAAVVLFEAIRQRGL